jgi:polyisoprenoid-binding protein YceI
MAVSLAPNEQAAALVPAGIWKIDPTHSSIEFQVKHMMIATVKGRFTDFDGTLEVGDDGALTARGTVEVASIDTHEPKRDAHLRSSEFFGSKTHPQMTFASTEITPLGEGRLRIVGDLTIKGTTRSVELLGEVGGIGVDPWGSERVGLEAHGEINREDFGLTWNRTLEAGSALVATNVRIEVAISAVRASGGPS